MKRPDCNYSEQYLLDASGRRDGREVNAHDCDYVDSRNALIHAAECMATETGAQRNSHKWSRQFLEAMDCLARKRGPVNGVSVM